MRDIKDIVDLDIAIQTKLQREAEIKKIQAQMNKW